MTCSSYLKMARLSCECVVVVLVALTLTSAQGQKRARPAFADLQMLISDNAGNNPESVNAASGQSYGDLATLADTLKRLQDLEKFYAHQSRPRYGRSVSENVLPLHQKASSETLFRTQQTVPRWLSVGGV